MAIKRKGEKRRKRSDDSEEEQFVGPQKLQLRNTYGIKINECLLQGLAEVRKEDPNIDMTEDSVRKLTNAICDACHDYYSYDKRGFKQKMFDIYINLKRENNHDLRRKVITRKMSVTQLIHADTRELAPDELQVKRQLEVEKHYLRNVILPGDSADQADSPEAVVPSLPQQTSVEVATNEPAGGTSPDGIIDSDSADTFGTLSDGFLVSNENSPESQSEVEDVSVRNREEGVGVEQMQQDSAVSSVEPQDLWSADETSNNKSSDDESEMSNKSDSSPEGLLFLQSRKRITADEDEGTRLPQPPDGSMFTVNKVLSRLQERLELLPAYIAKPFRGPLKCGHKRVTLLMGRSPILQHIGTESKKS